MLAVSDKSLVSVLGLVAGLIGALVIASGSMTFLHSDGDASTRQRERRLVAVGAFVVAVAFALQLLSKVMTGGLR